MYYSLVVTVTNYFINISRVGYSDSSPIINELGLVTRSDKFLHEFDTDSDILDSEIFSVYNRDHVTYNMKRKRKNKQQNKIKIRN